MNSFPFIFFKPALFLQHFLSPFLLCPTCEDGCCSLDTVPALLYCLYMAFVLHSVLDLLHFLSPPTPAGTRPWSSSCSPTPSWGSLCPRPWVSSVWWWLSSSCSPCKSLKPGLPHPPSLAPPFSSQSLSFLVSSFPPFLHPEGGFPEREPRMSWLAIPINRKKILQRQYLQKY